MKKYLGYLFYFIGFVFLFILYSIIKGLLYEYSKEYYHQQVFYSYIIGVIAIGSLIYLLLKYACRWTNFRPLYCFYVFMFIFINTSLIVCAVNNLFSSSTKPVNRNFNEVIWSKESLNWHNFTEVPYVSGNFSASIFSGVSYPKIKNNKSSWVYAYMIPGKSNKLKDVIDDEQLLIHEQYHFNITEYYARLLRKSLVEKGIENLDGSTIESIYRENQYRCDSLQDVYDSISDHNANTEEQRYWELKIDDLLRSTAYYEDTELDSYFNFRKPETNYYRSILKTLDNQLLTSNPITEAGTAYGIYYEVVEKDSIITIKYFENEQLKNGGVFNAAITKIHNLGQQTTEKHYYNPDGGYHSKSVAIVQTKRTSDKRETVYLDSLRQRTTYEGCFKVNGRYAIDGKLTFSYFNKQQQLIKNSNGIYHDTYCFDELGRTVKVIALNKAFKPMLDKEFTAFYEYTYTSKHLLKSFKKYDTDGTLAEHLSSYHKRYFYDEHGNVKQTDNLDAKGQHKNDNEGVSTYKYTYNNNDLVTSTKRYNAKGLETLGDSDYFMWVTEYDYENREVFSAQYLYNYTLKFNEHKDGAVRYKYVGNFTYEYNVDAYNIVFPDNLGVAIIKKTGDDLDRVFKEEYLLDEDKFATPKDGVVSYEYTYDLNGNTLESRAMDSLGNLVPFNSDVAIQRWQYDDRNNKIKTTYLTVLDSIANGNGNIAYDTYKYNKNNELIERRFYDKNMSPMSLEGSFKKQYISNRFGKDSLVKVFGANNKLLAGHCITRYIYNQYGNVIKELYYDVHNNRVLNDNGISGILFHYNKAQRYLGTSYLDIKGKLSNNNQGHCSKRIVIHSDGVNAQEVGYFDKYNSPVIGPNGYHKERYTYNSQSQLTKFASYNTDGNLMADEKGLAKISYIVASSGLIKQETYYDINNNLIGVGEQNAAKIKYATNLNGLYFMGSLYNENGEEIVQKEEL